jgi:adenine deaminase
MFCTDDRHPEDILLDGHIDNNIRLAISQGVDPVKAIQMATLNVASCYHLQGVGAIAPGYKADMVVLNDLESLEVYQVYKEGKLIAQEGKALFEIKSINDSKMRNSVNIKPLDEDCFSIITEEQGLRVIGLQPHSLVTKDLWRNVNISHGKYSGEDGTALLKIAVIERHNATGNIGLGLVEGLGLSNGAIASTVAHDSHNIVVIRDNDLDMRTAAEHLQEIGGGIAIASEGEVILSMPLPIGGLMSDIPLEELQEQLEDMLEIAYKMGVSKHYDPFMTLAFLALPVIPELKVTDLGLFDVVNFRFTKIDEV